jgi:tetratricopeptide (TPR) repeat protein
LLNFKDVSVGRTSIHPFLIFDKEKERVGVEEKLAMMAKATGHLLNGQMAQLARKPAIALQEYQNTLAINPDSSGAKNLIEYMYRERGEQLRKEKKFDPAIEAYTQALRYNPHSPKSNNNIATLYRASGQNDLAEQHFIEAIRCDSAYVTPLLNLGFLYVDAQKYEKAAEQFKAALSIDPANLPAKEGLRRLNIPSSQ